MRENQVNAEPIGLVLADRKLPGQCRRRRIRGRRMAKYRC